MFSSPSRTNSSSQDDRNAHLPSGPLALHGSPHFPSNGFLHVHAERVWVRPLALRFSSGTRPQPSSPLSTGHTAGTELLDVPPAPSPAKTPPAGFRVGKPQRRPGSPPQQAPGSFSRLRTAALGSPTTTPALSHLLACPLLRLQVFKCHGPGASPFPGPGPPSPASPPGRGVGQWAALSSPRTPWSRLTLQPLSVR